MCVCVCVCVRVCARVAWEGCLEEEGWAGTPPTSLPSHAGHQSDPACPTSTLACAGGSLGITPSRCT